MVTHDVDEALFLSDRVVMMTKGPRAHVGEILRVPFARPRQRMRVLEEPAYYALRERIIEFLEAQEDTPVEIESEPEVSTITSVPQAAPSLEREVG
jgi:ABC-type nitrate/sulfonate/bicarbonate transport system ATPase subunit